MKILLTVLLFLSLATQAKQHLPDSLIQDEVIFQRCNDFTLRYGLVIKVAAIGWYAPDCNSKNLLDTSNKILRFHYFKNVDAVFLKTSAQEYFILNLAESEIKPTLSNALTSFNDAYVDIQSGQYFQLIHINDQRLSLYRNEELLATTDNAVLARNYFNIWFGNKPVIQKLKKAFINL